MFRASDPYANLDHWDIALPVHERLNLGEINSCVVARELLFEAIVLMVAESLGPEYSNLRFPVDLSSYVL